ncbi:MAG: tetratricopeptide repeat protein [Endomicrobium sp.]|jgi:tetratricopeptide (TPR) repeat protein|nr:tetratricopeptide repeat protein [Endomicrobium sp.]
MPKRVYFLSLFFVVFLVSCSKDNYNIFARVAREISPKNHEVLIANGDRAFSSGDYERAQKYFEQALKNNPEDQTAIQKYVAAVVRIGSFAADIMEAKKQIDDTGNIDPDSFKNIATDRIHQINEGLKLVVDNPKTLQALLNGSTEQENTNNAMILALAAVTRIGDSPAIKEYFNLDGINDIEDISRKSFPDPSIIPEAIPDIRQALTFFEYAINCAAQASGENKFINQEMIDNLNKGYGELLSWLEKA